MAIKRVIHEWVEYKPGITWANTQTGSGSTYTIFASEPDSGCHCHTHHRFCCLKSAGKVDERSLDCDSSLKRESQDSKMSQGKTGGKRSRSHHRRRRLKATIRGGGKARR